MIPRETADNAIDDLRRAINKRLREMAADLCSELPQPQRPRVRAAVESLIRSIGEPGK
jgi:hypothetical protein